MPRRAPLPKVAWQQNIFFLLMNVLNLSVVPLSKGWHSARGVCFINATENICPHFFWSTLVGTVAGATKGASAPIRSQSSALHQFLVKFNLRLKQSFFLNEFFFCPIFCRGQPVPRVPGV